MPTPRGFDAKAIVGEILEGVDGADADAVRLLYGYYDCENIASLRAGRSAHNPLGNFTREELEEEVKTPRRLPAPVARVLRAFADPEGEDAEEVDTAGRFESALFGAYYEACSRSRSPFPARMVGVRPQPAQCDGRRDGPCGGAARRGGDRRRGRRGRTVGA